MYCNVDKSQSTASGSAGSGSVPSVGGNVMMSGVLGLSGSMGGGSVGGGVGGGGGGGGGGGMVGIGSGNGNTVPPNNTKSAKEGE
ncbi:hypothetical protein ZHAS_00007480 [Anopheles sinensis]|uniref:Uncharacterized protein n=1 Tax=Anopheles sinensis TaxID=74873 RepID=A0A084VPX8_ANOSI|nr:hypothetical protein ZHAS_00007480 [Anopheles sinensis]